MRDETTLLGLSGKVALVTGGGAGIGRASAELLARAGMRLAVAEIDPARAEALAAALGAGHFVRCLDVRRAEQVEDFITEIRQRFGQLDVLVNNVGDYLGLKGEFVTSSDEDWQALYDINLRQMFIVTRAALPLMQESGRGGSIINLSTVEAFRGIPLSVVYAAFKSAITGFTQSLAVEVGQYNIRVNAIAPETTNTAQITATPRVPPENLPHLARWFPIGRFGEASDSAGAVLYLASERLSGWVSGTTIPVDGGALTAGAWLRMSNDKWTHLPVIAADGYTTDPFGKGRNQP